MLEHRIRVISESLAREVDRRGFLRKVGGAIVTGVAAVVVGPGLGTQLRRASAAPILPNRARCAPPGPYCNLEGLSGGLDEPTGCRGAHCYQHRTSPGGPLLTCQVYYTFYATGCWTTADGGGYWTCCDCNCGSATCGCAQYNSTGGLPQPLVPGMSGNS
jgi:hypothetical protein